VFLQHAEKFEKGVIFQKTRILKNQIMFNTSLLSLIEYIVIS